MTVGLQDALKFECVAHLEETNGPFQLVNFNYLLPRDHFGDTQRLDPLAKLPLHLLATLGLNGGLRGGLRCSPALPLEAPLEVLYCLGSTRLL